MRAPVYRNIEAENTFLGLAFPTELLLVLFAYWLYLQTLPAWVGILMGVLTYALVRAVGRRRGPMFLQHWLVFTVRQRWTGGRLSAAARARCPRFPYAEYEWRDQPLRTVNGRQSTVHGPPVDRKPSTVDGRSRP